MQGYSPLSHVLKAAGEYEMRQPQTMKSLRGRKQGLINLVDIVCCNLDKVGGCRLEVRVRGEPGLSLADAIAAGKKQITSLLELLGRDIQVKKVKVSDYRDFVKQELAAAMAANVFRGMRDTGPTEEQRDLFHQKVAGWSTLVSNIGFVSGHFARAVSGNGATNQNPPFIPEEVGWAGAEGIVTEEEIAPVVPEEARAEEPAPVVPEEAKAEGPPSEWVTC